MKRRRRKSGGSVGEKEKRRGGKKKGDGRQKEGRKEKKRLWKPALRTETEHGSHEWRMRGAGERERFAGRCAFFSSCLSEPFLRVGQLGESQVARGLGVDRLPRRKEGIEGARLCKVGEDDSSRTTTDEGRGKGGEE